MRHFASHICVVAAVVFGLSSPARSDEGAELFDRGLYTEAMDWWRSAAGQGDPEAAFRLGDVYEAGAIVDENFEEAAKWYELAATSGHAGAQFALAAFYEAGAGVAPSTEKAAGWYRECANRGQPDCQFSLGTLLSDDATALYNPAEAYKWYYLAAKNGLIKFDAPELVDLASRMTPDQKREGFTLAVGFEAIE